MGLPDQTELLKLFVAFLFEAGLSAVSVKNYLCDLRHFLSFCTEHANGTASKELPTVKDIFAHLNKYLDHYLQSQKASFTPSSTTARRSASIRRFSTFLSVKFGISNIFTDQSTSKNIIENNVLISNHHKLENNIEKFGTDQTTSSLFLTPPTDSSFQASTQNPSSLLSSQKILEQFKISLEREKKSHSTVKNYLSDLNHFFLWTAKQTPFTNQNLVNILSEQLLHTYITYLKLSHTSTSVINRRQSSIKKLTKFCFEQGYIPQNPFEIRSIPQSLAPLAWIEKLSQRSKKKASPKGRLAIIYDRYSAMSWTPYLNLALLVLATTAMAIFAYNQIISQARPSAAATALTPPRRQLSFQGRLTDSGGTPITTAVSVVFKLFNALTGPTQLYTSGTCSITPDQDGIFNTLIGDGVCGAEIASSVFTDNRDVFLEITVGAETLTPRQQIATVGYALNSETLQGYPASAAATINTVPVMDNAGRIVLAQLNPSIIATSSSGTFTIKGDSLAFQTNINSGGDIILQPDALGSGQILALGGTTTEDSFRITNANLTSGSLISGYVGNDLAAGRLISLTSGSAETDRFWVATDGRTSIYATATNSALIVNQTGTGNLISASTSGTPRFTVTNGGNVDITGQYLINGVPFSGSNWQRTSGSLAPLNVTDSVNIGATATSSAYVHLAGTSGENSFINTGNFGIGTTTPSTKLDVAGNIQINGNIIQAKRGSDSAAGDILKVAQVTTAPAIQDATIITSIGASNIQLLPNNSTVNGLTMNGTSGNVGIGLTNPAQKLDVTGNVQFSGALMPGGTAGTTGQFLISAGAGTAPTWTSTIAASSIPFSGITTGINTSAAMTVDTGASLTYSNSGTINASSLIGGTWAVPGTIGSTTANTGAFTTLSASGLLSANSNLNVTGYATVSASLAVGYTNAPGGPGDGVFSGYVGIGFSNPAYALEVDGDISLTGALRASGVPGTTGQILSSTGTGIQWIDQSVISGTNFWQRNIGAVSPANIWESVNLGNTATNSATVHLAGVTGANSFINTGNFGIGLTSPAYKLDVNGDINLSGGIRASGSFGLSGQVLSSTGTGVQWITASSGSGSNWTIANGAIYPNNATLDTLIGGSASSSAKFAFINVDSGTPTASISSTVANLNTYLTGDGTLATTNRNSLTIGNSTTHNTTGNVLINPNGTGNVGIGTTNPGTKLDLVGAGTGPIGQVSQLTIGDGNGLATGKQLQIAYDTAGDESWIQSSHFGVGYTPLSLQPNGGNVGIGTTTPNFLLSLGTSLGNKISLYDSGAGNNYGLGIQSALMQLYTIDSGSDITFGYGQSSAMTRNVTFKGTGRVGIGTTDPLATLDIRGNLGTIPAASISGSTNQPALIVDQSGSGDIFDASSSGQTRFKIASNGTITTSLGLGIVHSSSLGVLSSSQLDLTTEVTGILPLANGGTNNNTYTSGKFLAYDGTKIASTAFDGSSFEAPLTFSNGLTRTVNAVTWGGTLTGTTTIAQAGFDVAFTGLGNFGIGVALPSQKLDVAGVFVVDTVNGRVGIGTTTPTVALDIAGTTSTISNSSGDITLNAASGFINFSGNSLNNFLDATVSGRLKLGNYPTVGLPTATAGTLVYDSTLNYPTYYNGTTWNNIGSFFNRTTTGIIYPASPDDSLNIGGTPSASSSALIRLSSNDVFYSFFMNPTAFGFNTGSITGVGTILEAEGDISPHTTATWNLGSASYQWQNLNLANGIFMGGTEIIAANTYRLTGANPWAALTGLRVGDGGSPVTNNALPSGIALYVNGNATVSGTFGVVGNTSLIGNVTVGGGTGKIDVGTVDPPYTINGEKYGTFMASMIGVKEEVMGKISASEFVSGVGYRSLIDLDGQAKGSDLWLFSKTTNLISNLDQLAVLLTATGQAKTWYEIDHQNNILAIYSSTPTDIIYRLTAPRFDAANWTNTRTSESIGFVINNPDQNSNTPGTGLLSTTIEPELIAQVDGTHKININGVENKEVSSFFQSIIANLQVGTQVVSTLLTDNLTIRTKLISPIADIDSLKVINATISGTLYADNIRGKTVDNLTAQLNLLDEKYATASAILASLQAKYTSYDSLLGKISTATISGDLSGMDPLALSPLATTSANIPSDLVLNSLNVHTIYSNDIMANGSVFAQAISSFDGDLYIQPTGDKSVHLLANLMTLYPDGKVVVNGDLLITGIIYSAGLDTRTATVSGTLALGKGEVASDSGNLIALFDSKGQIVGSVNASGSANFGQLTTGGLVIAAGNDSLSATMSAQTNSNTTIGTSTIATGSSEISIVNTKVTASTLIYLTPITNTSNQVLYVKSKQAGVGFTVAVPANPSQVKEQISFNYWLVETK